MKGMTRNSKIAGISLRRLAEQKWISEVLTGDGVGFQTTSLGKRSAFCHVSRSIGVFRLDFASCRSSNVDRMWPGSRFFRSLMHYESGSRRVPCC